VTVDDTAAGPRERLLAASRQYVVANGIGGLSLRKLAAAIGTSHRMLIYHFGSKEGLLAEIVRTVEQEQRAALDLLLADSSLTPAEQARRFWDRLIEPATENAGLFFELVGQALQGRPHTAALRDQLVDMWLEPLVAVYVRAGESPEHARAVARLGLAASRGLLLDLLATGDREGVDAAMNLLIDAFTPGAPP
jgi:AcrR family transcriptional regulator